MKENQNSLDYNVWSGTDYEPTSITPYTKNSGVEAISSNDYSVIGEHSLKITRLSETANYLDVPGGTASSELNVSYSLSFKCSENSYLSIVLREPSLNVTRIITSEGQEGDIQLSGTIHANTRYYLRIFVYGDIGGYCYVDNLSLTTQ